MSNNNKFGGNWTEAKMEIVVSYAKAYLMIMNKQTWAKTMYFDGFAGSGIIESQQKEELKKGTARYNQHVQHVHFSQNISPEFFSPAHPYTLHSVQQSNINQMAWVH